MHEFGPSAWPHRKCAYPPETVHAIEKRGPPQGRASCMPGSGQPNRSQKRHIFSWPYFKNVEIQQRKGDAGEHV